MLTFDCTKPIDPCPPSFTPENLASPEWHLEFCRWLLWDYLVDETGTAALWMPVFLVEAGYVTMQYEDRDQPRFTVTTIVATDVPSVGRVAIVSSLDTDTDDVGMVIWIHAVRTLERRWQAIVDARKTKNAA